MSISQLKGSVVNAYIWAPIHEVESVALDQIRNVASLPWVFHHVAVMADCHFGKGCTVGSVVAMKDALSPAMIGVDISCGMAACKTNLKASDLPDDLKLIRAQIERDIPVGFNKHDRLPRVSNEAIDLIKRYNSLYAVLDGRIKDKYGNIQLQLGTLGGGNHFIELCLDTEDNVWMMLHSGSRNIGKELAEFHIEKARKLAHNMNLPDRDLAVFLAKTPEMEEYKHDLYWASDYAWHNRQTMLKLFEGALLRFFPQLKIEQTIQCHHNYLSEEIHFGEQVYVTRKGAINAENGKLGIIPGSMGTGSYIVRGLGNPESFNSASHGAGRRMSRGKAKKTFTMEDVEKQLKGVECRHDSGIIDELPGAYKDVKAVMENQKDLVEIVAELRQVLCVKG